MAVALLIIGIMSFPSAVKAMVYVGNLISHDNIIIFWFCTSMVVCVCMYMLVYSRGSYIILASLVPLLCSSIFASHHDGMHQ